MATFEIRCEVAGKVARIEAHAGAHVAEGDAVEEGQHVATLRA